VAAYNLTGATVGGITPLLPTSDTNTPNYSAGNFLKAAELFGAEYGSAAGNALDLGALQIAVWDTEYGIAGTGDAGSIYNTALATQVGYYLGQTSFVGTGSLGHVIWWDYNPQANSGGQGQFEYNTTPQAVPEPFTMVLGLAAVGFAARRRLSAKKLSATVA
jgi:hypothetical protein